MTKDNYQISKKKNCSFLHTYKHYPYVVHRHSIVRTG